MTNYFPSNGIIRSSVNKAGMTENTVEKQDEVQYVNSGQGDNMKATGDDSLLESASYKEVSKNIFK